MCALEMHRSLSDIAACYVSQIVTVEVHMIYKRRDSNTPVQRCSCTWKSYKIMASMLIRGQLGSAGIVNKTRVLFHVLPLCKFITS